MTPIYLHVFWHQHQPWYPAPDSGMCSMPWVRLHGIKDYYDMAALCQTFDGWKQTINLVPSLLDQIVGYVDGSIDDRAMVLSRTPAADLTADEKREVLTRFFDAHAPRLIHPHPRYDELFRKRGGSVTKALGVFTEQDYLDLQVWFNLAWIDPIWLENQNLPLHGLLQKQRDFSEDEKQSVLDIHIDILNKIIPIHRQMHQEGRLELTTTPYYHPILPLLCNTSIAQISNPRDPVPDPPFVHPEDAEWHIREGLNRFEQLMGFRPQGMWPSEGSVSDEACSLIAQAGLNYFCTSQDILYRSQWTDEHHQQDAYDNFRLHRLSTAHGDIDCVFRHQELSDLIGFHYANRDAKDAASDFIAHVKHLVEDWPHQQPPLVNVILDGENCWEFYPRDGHDFLQYLIEGILHDSQIVPTTVPEYRNQHPTTESTLRSIHPGSWIAHNFRIWIGHPEDNAAWHYVRNARDTLEQHEKNLSTDQTKEAWEEIYIAEGSDWYWWFGDENASAHDELFDEAFRQHLERVYLITGQPVPEELKRPIKRIQQDEWHGTLLLTPPKISGKQNGYYDWIGAKRIQAGASTGAMHQADHDQTILHLGRFQNQLCFFIDFGEEVALDNSASLTIQITQPAIRSKIISAAKPSDTFRINKRSMEGAIDLSDMGLEMHQEVWFFFECRLDKENEISIPAGNVLYLPAYTVANASRIWFE